MADVQKRIAKNLVRLLSERHISAERLAYEVGISKGYIYDVVNGKANITVTKLEKIARGLKVRIQDLLD